MPHEDIMIAADTRITIFFIAQGLNYPKILQKARK
jgi:hypothetical protein